MFEKEAEEYGIASREFCADVDDSDLIAEAYKDGAEFGYNKANEWHYPSKGEYPKNDNDILCQIDFETSEVGYFNDMFCNFFTIDGKELNVIAWKEIVLPELKEGE